MCHFLSFGATDAGLCRPNNEDAYLIGSDIGVLAVADGMGGAAAGEVASAIFVRTAAEIFSRHPAAAPEGSDLQVREVFRVANERIISDAAQTPEYRGMGCTAELLALCGDHYVVGHVGDSRTYIYRSGKLQQVTKDHSLVQQQLDLGLISAAEAKRHALKNVVLRALGIDPSLALDVSRGRIWPGDLFLLCSDGLTDMMDDAAIGKILATSRPLQEKARMLIDGANSAGGKDNVTVVLCQTVCQ